MHEDDDEIVELLKNRNVPLTRENYLDLSMGRGWTEDDIGPELESTIPSRFRRDEKKPSKILRRK